MGGEEKEKKGRNYDEGKVEKRLEINETDPESKPLKNRQAVYIKRNI